MWWSWPGPASRSRRAATRWWMASPWRAGPGCCSTGVKHCLEVEHVMDPEDAEVISGLIRTGPGAYRAWLEQTVGRLRCVEPAVPRALRALGGVLATLSYDGLLEEATGWKPVTWL